MLHVAFLRSQVAHARILKIDVSEALQRPASSPPTSPATSAITGNPALYGTAAPIAALSSTSEPGSLAKDKSPRR